MSRSQTTKKGSVAKKTAEKPANGAGASKRIDEMIARLPDWRGAQLAEIRRLIHEVDRGVLEEWKWRGAPVWSHEGMYLVANAHKDKVKVTFFHGAQLSDPKKLFNAGLTGNKWRAIDLYEGDKLDKAGFKALLREAIAYNETHKVAKSRGSRAKPMARTSTTKKPAKKEPTLLSGGNPQIAKGDGDGPVRAYIAAMPGWKRDVGRRLDALVVRAAPHVQKAVRWNSPFYGVEGQGWFLSFHCFTKYVKVVFLRGASLRPLPPVASKHPHTRYYHLHEGDEVESEQLARWIEQASKLPGEPLF